MWFQALLVLFLCAHPLVAVETLGTDSGSAEDRTATAVAIESSAVGATPTASLNLLSFGTVDGGWALSYERFLDARTGLQFEADNGSQAYLGSNGVGAAFRVYPIGRASASFYGGARLRLFEQNVWGNGTPGFYRGLRGGPQIGVRLPAFRDLVISYELAWSWDLSLYQSDPAMIIGESWKADAQYSGNSGRITDALSVGWLF